MQEFINPRACCPLCTAIAKARHPHGSYHEGFSHLLPARLCNRSPKSRQPLGKALCGGCVKTCNSWRLLKDFLMLRRRWELLGFVLAKNTFVPFLLFSQVYSCANKQSILWHLSQTDFPSVRSCITSLMCQHVPSLLVWTFGGFRNQIRGLNSEIHGFSYSDLPLNCCMDFSELYVSWCFGLTLSGR